MNWDALGDYDPHAVRSALASNADLLLSAHLDAARHLAAATDLLQRKHQALQALLRQLEAEDAPKNEPAENFDATV